MGIEEIIMIDLGQHKLTGRTSEKLYTPDEYTYARLNQSAITEVHRDDQKIIVNTSNNIRVSFLLAENVFTVLAKEDFNDYDTCATGKVRYKIDTVKTAFYNKVGSGTFSMYKKMSVEDLTKMHNGVSKIEAFATLIDRDFREKTANVVLEDRVTLITEHTITLKELTQIYGYAIRSFKLFGYTQTGYLQNVSNGIIQSIIIRPSNTLYNGTSLTKDIKAYKDSEYAIKFFTDIWLHIFGHIPPSSLWQPKNPIVVPLKNRIKQKTDTAREIIQDQKETDIYEYIVKRIKDKLS